MPKSIFHPEDLSALESRLARLTPNSARTFGKMTPAQMICHLNDSLDIAMGAVNVPAKKSIMWNSVVRYLVIYHLPWPKGKVETLPEFLATKPVDWNADVQRLRDKLRAASARGPNAHWPPHPAFGNLSGKAYGALIHKHFDHHLGQFNV